MGREMYYCKLRFKDACSAANAYKALEVFEEKLLDLSNVVYDITNNISVIAKERLGITLDDY